MIFLWGAVVGGAFYDLVKEWIKALRNKHPKWRIVIIGKNNIMFAVKWDLTINVVVIPERQKEFEHIKEIDDVIDHIKKQIEDWVNNS
jgi:hypothetical protein